MFKFSAYLSSRLLNKTYVLLHIFCAIVTHRLCIKVSIIILTGSGKTRLALVQPDKFFTCSPRISFNLPLNTFYNVFYSFMWCSGHYYFIIFSGYMHKLLKHPGAYFYTMIFNKFHWKIHNLISRFHKAKLKRNLQKTQLRVLGMFKNTEYM